MANLNPSKLEGTFGSEVVNRSLLYGVLGYLPEETCNVLILPGPKQGQMALLLESNGYQVSRLCDENDDMPGCINTNIDSLPEESFGVVIAPGWLAGEGETEKITRQAMRLLVDGGFFIGSVASRFAAAIDLAQISIDNAKLLASGIENKAWQESNELFTPNEVALVLEAVEFEVVDFYGWEIALSRLSDKQLGSYDWTEEQVESFMELEFRLAQERSILGIAPTIQFICKKHNPEN